MCGEERGACDEGQGQEPGSSESSQGDSELNGQTPLPRDGDRISIGVGVGLRAGCRGSGR